MTPPMARAPLVVLIVCVAESAIARLIRCVLALLLVIPPLRVIALPERVNDDAVEANVRPAKLVLPARLLLVLVCTDPSNVSESPPVGAWSGFQLAAVAQLASTPPPSQTSAAA